MSRFDDVFTVERAPQRAPQRDALRPRCECGRICRAGQTRCTPCIDADDVREIGALFDGYKSEDY